MAEQPPIQGRVSQGVSLDAIKENPTFKAWPQEKQLRYLDEVYLPATSPRYKGWDAGKRQRYLQEVVVPNLIPAPALPTFADAMQAHTPQNPTFAPPVKPMEPPAPTLAPGVNVQRDSSGHQYVQLPDDDKYFGRVSYDDYRPWDPHDLAGRLWGVGNTATFGTLNDATAAIERYGNVNFPDLDEAQILDARTAALPVSVGRDLGAVLATGGAAMPWLVAGHGKENLSRQVHDQGRDFSSFNYLSPLVEAGSVYLGAQIPGAVGNNPWVRAMSGPALGAVTNYGFNVLQHGVDTGEWDVNPFGKNHGMATAMGFAFGMPGGVASIMPPRAAAPRSATVPMGDQPVSLAALRKQVKAEAAARPQGRTSQEMRNELRKRLEARVVRHAEPDQSMRLVGDTTTVYGGTKVKDTALEWEDFNQSLEAARNRLAAAENGSPLQKFNRRYGKKYKKGRFDNEPQGEGEQPEGTQHAQGAEGGQQPEAPGEQQGSGQGPLTPEDLHARAAGMQEDFWRDMQKVAKESGLYLDPKFQGTVLKSLESLQNKLQRKGPGYVPTDLLRTTLRIDVGEVPGAKIEAVRKALESQGYRIVEVENGYLRTEPGYKDVKIIVEKNGVQAEIQMNRPWMQAAKDEWGGHTMYDQTKAYEIMAKEGPVTRQDKADWDTINAAMNRLYESAERLDSAGVEFNPNLDPNLASNRLNASRSSLDKNVPDRLANENTLSDQDLPAESFDMSNPPTDRGSSSTIAHDGKSLKPGGPKVYGKPATVYTEKGTRIETRYALAEAGNLITSHDDQFNENPRFAQDLQPRDRSRADSRTKVMGYARDLKPEFLGESVKASDGAPIVGKDMLVESGNGRTMAIRQAYRNHPEQAAKYKAYLKENAEAFGIKPEDLDGMKEPVLIRQRETDLDPAARRRFVEEANEGNVAGMGAVEQAKADAAKIDDALLVHFKPDEDGNFLNPANRQFVQSFLEKVVPSNERAGLVDAGGQLSQDGVNRIKRAIFAKAYGEGEGAMVLERMAESTDNNMKNVSNAMLAKAGDMVKLKAAIAAGERHDLDISGDLSAAAAKLGRLREEGTPVEEYLGQQRLLGDDLTPFQKTLLKTLNEHKRSSRKMAAIIGAYVEQVDALGNPKQAGLFQQDLPTREALWGKAVKQAETGGQGSLFDSEPASMTQARQAQANQKSRRRKEQGGFMRIGGAVQVVQKGSQFNPKGAGVADLVGATHQEPPALQKMKDGLRDLFVYMNKVKDKTYDIAGRKAQGNKFISLVDQLRARMQRGYADAELKVRNAIDNLEDMPGYTARQKMDDVMQYLLYADYIRRAQDGMPVPGGLTMAELRAGYRKVAKHVRDYPDVRKTVLNTRALLNEIGRDLVKAGVIQKQRKQYFPHQVLEHMNQVYGLPVQVKTPSRGYAKAAKGSVKDIETNLVQGLNNHLKAIARHNAIDDFIKKTINEYALPKWNIGDPLPEGFAEFQPRSGNQYFQALSIPEKAIMQSAWEYALGENALNRNAFDQAAMHFEGSAYATLNKARKILAVGSPRKTYAMPVDVVHYLNRLYEPKYLEGRSNVVTKAVQMWKGIVTASPLNPGVIAFHFRNTIGDVENALRDDPGLSAYVAQAAREMYAARKGNPTPRILTAEEWGTIGAGYYGAEMGLRQTDFYFKARFSDNPIQRALTRTPILSQAVKLVGKYSDKVVDLGAAREDLLRYAKFLKDTDAGLEPWQAHIENGRVFVNYNHLTPFERDFFRDTLLPFYTFYKANAVNWYQGMTGQRGKASLIRSWGLAMALPMAAAAWNQLADPEYEDLLQDRKSKRYLSNQVHIVTPFKDNKGNQIVILLPTASNAALQLAGLSRLPYRLSSAVQQIYEGKASMTDTLKEQIGKALGEDLFVPVGKGDDLKVPRPVAETVELMNPYIKEVAQQAFDYDLFLGRSITTGDESNPKKNAEKRLMHAMSVAVPPFQRLTGSTFKDPALAALDMLVGVVKAPDLYSWSDLKDEEQRVIQERRRIKNPKLRDLYEKAETALYDEKARMVYDARFAGERYGKKLTPEQRLRVDQMLKAVKQGDGLSYSASANTGLLKLIKSMDEAYAANPTAAQRAALKKQEALIPLYMQKLKTAEETRIRAAVTAVKASNDPKTQSKIFKALTKGAMPADVAARLDQKFLGGKTEYLPSRKRP